MKFAIAVLAALVVSSAVAADKDLLVTPKGETVSGACAGVHDGDTMTLLVETPDGKRQAKIRLDAIDAPELGQPYSQRSKQTLKDLVFGKDCKVESLGPDKYDRTIGRVTVDGKDVNAAMLGAGMAWHFAKYDQRESMAARHNAARDAKRGLWADAKAIASVSGGRCPRSSGISSGAEPYRSRAGRRARPPLGSSGCHRATLWAGFCGPCGNCMRRRSILSPLARATWHWAVQR